MEWKNAEHEGPEDEPDVIELTIKAETDDDKDILHALEQYALNGDDQFLEDIVKLRCCNQEMELNHDNYGWFNRCTICKKRVDHIPRGIEDGEEY